jgi:hypothetical protein
LSQLICFVLVLFLLNGCCMYLHCMLRYISYKYDIFNGPLMTDAEFDSKPQVMLVGQYSVGKTSVGGASEIDFIFMHTYIYYLD